ncbi:MAG TPA: twin-arginine translocase TatA/TatE family subunit [Kofleriaceae bacterium]
MFGMGGTEILVILIVALLFLGPDKLPEAAKQISKGIRDIKRQSRVLQRTIEDDEHIGGAIRDLRSALRGEDEPIRPRPIKPPPELEAAATPDAIPAVGAIAAAAVATHAADPDAIGDLNANAASLEGGHMSAPAPAPTEAAPNGEHGAAPAADAPRITLPATAGEAEPPEPGHAAPASSEDAELASLVKPAPNTIPRGSTPAEPSEPSEPKHG